MDALAWVQKIQFHNLQVAILLSLLRSRRSSTSGLFHKSNTLCNVLENHITIETLYCPMQIVQHGKNMSKTSSTRNLAFVSCESCKCIQKKWESYMLSSVCMWSLVSVQRSHLLRKSSTAGHDYSPSTTWCCHWSHMKTFLPLLVYPFKGEGITDFVRLLCIWRAWPSSYRKTYYIRGPTKQLYLWKMTVLAGSTRRKRPRNWQVIQMTGVSQQSVCVCHSKNILSVTDSRKKERVPEHICSNSSRKSYLSEAKWGGAR